MQLKLLGNSVLRFLVNVTLTVNENASTFDEKHFYTLHKLYNDSYEIFSCCEILGYGILECEDV
jgi:hypothetical protein